MLLELNEAKQKKEEEEKKAQNVEGDDQDNNDDDTKGDSNSAKGKVMKKYKDEEENLKTETLSLQSDIYSYTFF